MDTKNEIRTDIRVDAYVVVQRAVEEGVAYGYRRAYKHTDVPGEHVIKNEIEEAVMNALCEVLRFDPVEK